MDPIRFTSIQAPNQDFIGRLLSPYIGARLGIEASYVEDRPWQERERLLDRGEIGVGWICGLPYIMKADRPEPAIELLVAPVMIGERYGGRPIYFSDVIVHKDRPFENFADLRGVTWAYSEPNSQSGYNITRYHLATLGEMAGYFGRVKAAGSHENALELVRKRKIDASAIDTTVLEVEYRNRPKIVDEFRVIETLGPSPIPPWVVSLSHPAGEREAIRQVFLGMHEDTAGQEVLAKCQIERFVRVKDEDYDVIRQMAKEAAGVRW